MPRLPLPPRRRVHSRTREQRPDPYYGYGYNPTWASILSVAHDETDGGALFVILDRPCVLNAPGTNLPLVVPEGAGLSIVSASLPLPIKLRVALSGPLARGAAWRWNGGVCDLFDPMTGNYPNPASGYCADVPGPYVPPPLPAVVSTAFSGNTVNLVFDQPVSINGNPPDESITVNGVFPSSVGSADAYTLWLGMPDSVNSGDPWIISAQPGWIDTVIAVPEGGVL